MGSMPPRAERGVEAELSANERLEATYKRFMEEPDPSQQNEAGRDLVCAIFGEDAIAEDRNRGSTPAPTRPSQPVNPSTIHATR
jgi:hypothetical protein